MPKKKVTNKAQSVRGLMAVFMLLILIFAGLTFLNPVVGLVGLGVVSVVMAIVIEINRDYIWSSYRKEYKKSLGIRGWWSEPNKLFYQLNVYILWPLVGLLGLTCLWAAWVYRGI
jgi:hypothetical protein